MIAFAPGLLCLLATLQLVERVSYQLWLGLQNGFNGRSQLGIERCGLRHRRGTGEVDKCSDDETRQEGHALLLEVLRRTVHAKTLGK